ncbi:MAG: hypothetical protein E7292_12115 [Lachnospiraceae bacterium]|nr:hypothetical protein [Lachnospiraceae bacterium]
MTEEQAEFNRLLQKALDNANTARENWEEAYMFKSPREWKEIIGDHSRIEKVETWEMECFENVWSEWF